MKPDIQKSSLPVASKWQGALLQEVIDVLSILNALRLTWQRKIEADIKS